MESGKIREDSGEGQTWRKTSPGIVNCLNKSRLAHANLLEPVFTVESEKNLQNEAKWPKFSSDPDAHQPHHLEQGHFSDPGPQFPYL